MWCQLLTKYGNVQSTTIVFALFSHCSFLIVVVAAVAADVVFSLTAYSSNKRRQKSVEKENKNWVIKLFFLNIHNSFTIVHLLRTHHCIYGKKKFKN